MKETKRIGPPISYDDQLDIIQAIRKETPENSPSFLTFLNELINQGGKIKTTTTIEDLTDSYKITDVPYRNKIYTVNLFKELEPSRTQEEHSKTNKVADMPLYHAIFTTLFKNKDNPKVEEIRDFLETILKDNYLLTLSRINYQPKRKIDEVIHNYNQPTRYEIKENIVDPDEWVKNSTNSKPYKAILGTDNLQEINQVYKWLTRVEPHIWRVNSKPNQIDPRVVGFVAGSDGLVLDCFRSPQYSGPALGVALREQISPSKTNSTTL